MFYIKYNGMKECIFIMIGVIFISCNSVENKIEKEILKNEKEILFLSFKRISSVKLMDSISCEKAKLNGVETIKACDYLFFPIYEKAIEDVTKAYYKYSYKLDGYKEFDELCQLKKDLESARDIYAHRKEEALGASQLDDKSHMLILNYKVILETGFETDDSIYLDTIYASINKGSVQIRRDKIDWTNYPDPIKTIERSTKEVREAYWDFFELTEKVDSVIYNCMKLSGTSMH